MRLVPAVACAITAVAIGSAAAQSQMELNAQAGSDLRKSDAQLNAVFNNLRAKISDAGKKSLHIAQQPWLRIRDQEVDFEPIRTVAPPLPSTLLSPCPT